MSPYFNEIDAFPAEWLKRLWPASRVDARSICEVRPDDLIGVRRAHFFAGIGGWEHALQLAGWPADREVWTGSCPCQPFSNAGKGKAEADERHLWPDFRFLIQERRPATVFGEQVASNLGRDWLARVRDDLEALGYVVGAADLCAASVGAPHKRQRLYWVAHTEYPERGSELQEDSNSYGRDGSGRSGAVSGLADTDGGEPRDGDVQRSGEYRLKPEDNNPSGLGLADSNGRQTRISPAASVGLGDSVGSTGSVGGGMGYADFERSQRRSEFTREHAHQRSAWAASILIPCADGHYRRVPANEAGELEPSLFPLAYGVSGRVGRLRAYGNAIVPPLAAAFIRSFLDVEVENLI